MTTFDERELAFENKFARDEDMKFKARAHANKLLGLWAAEQLGKTGPEADAYAHRLITTDLEEAGHDDVVLKVVGDMGDVTANEIRAKAAEFLNQAKGKLLDQG